MVTRHIQLENSDWTCIINPEVKSDTNELFLTFKLLKRRYRSSEEDEKLRRLDYFNHPFEPNNEIRLIDDIDLPRPLSLESLATHFEPIDEKRGKQNAIDREVKDSGKKKKKHTTFIDEDPEEFDVFSEDVALNY